MTSILLFFLLSLPNAVMAQETVSSFDDRSESIQSAPAPGTDWARVDERMTTGFKVGTNIFWGGLISSFVGGAINQPLLSAMGSLATSGGAITRTATSLRQRRSIEARGVSISSTWGYTSWALMGAGFGLGMAGSAYMEGLEFDEDGNPPPESMGPIIGFSLGTLAVNLGGLVAASRQMKVNAMQRMRIGESKSSKSTILAHARLLPTFDRTGRMGIGLNTNF